MRQNVQGSGFRVQGKSDQSSKFVPSTALTAKQSRDPEPRTPNPERHGHRRGAALILVMVTALVFSIAAFGVLTMAVSRAQQVDYLSEDRVRARFAAEAGLVWATQQLWVNPNFPHPACGGGGPPPINKLTTWPAALNGLGTNVQVAVDNCGADRIHTLHAQVTF